jgi:nicotinamidase-related amidase
MLPQNTALLIIDVQQGFDDPKWGPRNNPDAESVIETLLAEWREAGRPVFHVQHLSAEENSPLAPNQPGCEFKPEAMPLANEPVIQKHVNSGFIGTGLENSLRDEDINTLVIVGLTTNHCVSTTTRMAGNLGFNVYVVSNAAATFDLTGPDGVVYPAEQVHNLALASLHGEFAQVVDSEFIVSQFEVAAAS